MVHSKIIIIFMISHNLLTDEIWDQVFTNILPLMHHSWTTLIYNKNAAGF